MLRVRGWSSDPYAGHRQYDDELTGMYVRMQCRRAVTLQVCVQSHGYRESVSCLITVKSDPRVNACNAAKAG